MTIRALAGPAKTFQRSKVSLSHFVWQGIVEIAALLILFAPPISLGARTEGLFFPIRVSQSILKDSIVRTKDRLCWTWISDKVRMAISDNVDVFLDTADGDRSYPEVFDRTTNMPWHRNGAVPIGHYQHGYCVMLPPYIKRDDPIRLSQIIHYRGF